MRDQVEGSRVWMDFSCVARLTWNTIWGSKTVAQTGGTGSRCLSGSGKRGRRGHIRDFIRSRIVLSQHDFNKPIL